jgi:hypothetical protein
MGWLANLLIILSWWLLAKKHRYALLLGVAGSLLWCAVAVQKRMPDLVAVEVVLAALGIRAWVLWGED